MGDARHAEIRIPDPVTGRAGRPAQRYALGDPRPAAPPARPGVGLDARACALAAACPSPGRTARPSRSRTPSSLSPHRRNGVPRGRRRLAALDPAARRLQAFTSSALPPHRTTVLVLAREATCAARLALRLVPRLVLRRLFPLALLALFAFPLLLVLATALLLRVVFLAT